MIIHVLDKNEKVVGVLSNEAPFSCPFFDDLHVENIQAGTNTFEFSVPANHAMSEKLEVEGSVIFPDLDGKYQMFKIKNIEETASKTEYVKRVTTEHIAISDLLTEIIRPTGNLEVSLDGAVNYILKGTGYKLGDWDYSENHDIVFDKHITVLEALYKVAEEFQVELQFEITFKNGKVVDKLIHMKEQLGTVTNKLFTYSKDLDEVVRTENSEALVTALIGVGKGDEDGTVLTLAGHNPKELPEGFYKKPEDDFIYSEPALQKYGKNGKHKFGIYTSEAEDLDTLTKDTIKELKARSVPYVTWQMKVALLERVTGYSADKVRVGDTINAKDITMKPTLMIEARIIEVSRSYTSPENDEILLGHYRPVSLNNYDDIQALREAIIANEEKWSNSGVSIPEVEEVVEGKVKPIERDLSNVKEEVKEKEYAIIRQDEEPTGTSYEIGQLWIDGNDFIYSWTGKEWKKLISVSLTDIGAVGEEEYNKAISDIQKAQHDYNNKISSMTKDIASKVNAEYVDGKLVYKADADNVYTKVETDTKLEGKAEVENVYSKKEVDNALNSKVSNTEFKTDMDGVIKELDSHDSRITQTENELKSTVSSQEYSQKVTELESNINKKANSNDVYNKTNVDTKLKGKADNSKVTALETRIGNAETSIIQTDRKIGLKADANNVYTKTETNNKLNGKADNSKVTALEKKVEDTNAELSVQADKIASKVSSSTYNQKMKEVDSNISKKANTADVNSKLANKADNSKVTAVETRLSKAETAIDQTDKAIKLKADASEVYTKSETDKAIEDVEIGASNLLTNTDFSKEENINKLGKPSPVDSIKPLSTIAGFEDVPFISVQASNPTVGDHPRVTLLGSKFNIKEGETYTLSFIGFTSGYVNNDFNYTLILRNGIGFRVDNKDFSKKLLGEITQGSNTYKVYKYKMTFVSQWSDNNAYPMIGTTAITAKPTWFRFANVMLEKGNKASDWKPSYEDTEEKINNVEEKVTKAQAELTVQSDRINSKVSSTDYNKKVNSIETRVKNAETAINQTKNDISLKANAKDVYTKGNVDSKVNAKADNSKVNAIEKRVSENESELKVQANQISSRVTKSEMNNAINNIHVGGKNILQYTDFSKQSNIDDWFSWLNTVSSISSKKVGDYHFLHMNINSNVTVGSTPRIRTPYRYKLIKGKEYTISWLAFGSDYVSSTPYAGIYVNGLIVNNFKDAKKERVTNVTYNNLNKTVYKYTYTFTFNGNDDDECAIYMGAEIVTAKPCYFMFTQPMLEEGNNASSWQPSNEDTETRISNAESRITQTEKDITSKVSSSKYNADVGNLKTRMSSAESTIKQQDNKISSKVSTTDYTGSKIASKLVQTSSALDLIAKNINLTGKVTFNSFDTATKNRITGVESKASSAKSTATNAQNRVNSVEGKINNAVTTIDNTGVTVKNGSFYLADDESDVKFNVVQKSNLIQDHSFELTMGKFETLSVKHYWMDIHYPYENQDSRNNWWWVGKPKVSVDIKSIANSNAHPIFGDKHVAVVNKDYVWQTVRGIRPSESYTLSAFFKRHYNVVTGGKPRFEVYAVDAAGNRGKLIASKTFPAVSSNYKVSRQSLTFKTPSNLDPTGGVDVIIKSANTEWVAVDGVQLVEGNTPVLYNPEENLWRLATNGLFARELHADTLNARSIQFQEQKAGKFDKYGNIQAKPNVSITSYWSIKNNGGSTLARFPWGVKAYGVQPKTAIEFAPSGYPDKFELFNLGSGNVGIKGAGRAIIKWIKSSDTIQIRTGADKAYTKITASNFNTASRREFKSYVNKSDCKALPKILDTTVYNYYLNSELTVRDDDGNELYGMLPNNPNAKDVRRQIGLIYEEAPEEIIGDEDSINLYAMQSLLWKGMQEHVENTEKENERLRKELEETKQELTETNKRLEAIEKKLGIED